MGLKGPLKNKDGLIEEPGDMIIKVSGFNPILGRQILYFKDTEFLRRAQLQMAEESDVLLNAGANDAPSRKREETRGEAEKKSEGNGPAAAAVSPPAAPKTLADDVKVSNSKEISGECMDFISQLKNPFTKDIEKLASDESSFLFFKQDGTPSGTAVYDNDDLFKGNEDEIYTGDEPDVFEIPEIEMNENGREFYEEFIKVDAEYWQGCDDDDETDEMPLVDGDAETAAYKYA
jgi:hypothetical protein